MFVSQSCVCVCVAGVEVKAGKEVECAVLEVGDDGVRVSLNPALVEACRTRREGEEGRKEGPEEGRRSGDPDTDVSRTLPVGFLYETGLPSPVAGWSVTGSYSRTDDTSLPSGGPEHTLWGSTGICCH